ncbi:hypothetical protein DSLASN_41600 [Desulfoluna limicola]|uniref:Uncharacterized protein n=1 Tax=Desulfoluna limicola TaxID=2810562 RepID=A0ABM7PMV4_9BACT|nr:hypothetical protein DSLASN_41600 [Desulfoluna limicola]
MGKARPDRCGLSNLYFIAYSSGGVKGQSLGAVKAAPAFGEKALENQASGGRVGHLGMWGGDAIYLPCWTLFTYCLKLQTVEPTGLLTR